MKQQKRISSTSILLMNSENRRTKDEYYRQGEQGQTPQRNKKTRLKWTKELHHYFVQAVNQLGGAYEATPKNIVKLMGVQEITSSHIKSHLQKYRHSKEFCKKASTKGAENGIAIPPYEANPENKYTKILGWHTCEASRDIQTHKTQKHSMEGGQRHFQTESEKSENFQQQVLCSQGKSPIAVLEKIPETIKRRDKISEETKSKKDQLYEPATGCQTPIHSLSSCLNFCKATEKNQETYKVGAKADSNTQLALNEIEKKHTLETDGTMQLAAIKKDTPLYSSLSDRDWNVEEVEAKQKLDNVSPMSIGLQVTEANSSSRFLEGGPKTRAEYYNNVSDLDAFAAQVEPIRVPNESKTTSENRPSYGSRESKFAANYQSFDLNVPMLDEQVGKE